MTGPSSGDDPPIPPARPGRVVVAGAGLAGLRTIEELRGRGYDGAITLVGAESRLPYDRPPLSKKLMIGALDDTTLRTELASLDVEVRLGERATGVADGRLTTDRDAHSFDILVLATGATPVTLPGEGRQHVLRTVDDALELRKLRAPGTSLAIGVAVDSQLRTSVPGVYAVGDCAAFWSGRYGRRLRFEHWDVALHAPTVAAANITGGDEAYDPVPYFWSEQFGRMVQYVGYHGAADRLVWRGDPAAQKWAVAWLAADRLVALLTVSLPRDLLQGRRVIESGAPVDAARLADPAVAVRDTVAA